MEKQLQIDLIFSKLKGTESLIIIVPFKYKNGVHAVYG